MAIGLLPVIFTLSESVSRTVHVDARHAVLEFRLYWRSSCLNKLLTLMYIADSKMLYTMNGKLADGLPGTLLLIDIYKTKDDGFAHKFSTVRFFGTLLSDSGHRKAS